MLKRILTIAGILMIFTSFGFAAADDSFDKLQDQKTLGQVLYAIVDHPWLGPLYTLGLVGSGAVLALKNNGIILSEKLNLKKILAGFVLILFGINWKWMHYTVLYGLIHKATGETPPSH